MIGVFVVLLMALLASPAWATTYYLSAGGHGETLVSDANTCTQAQTITTPKATMNSILACAALTGGDTIYIRGGTYNQRMDFITAAKNGTASAQLVIAGYPGDSVPLWQYHDPIENDYGGIKAWGNSYLTFRDFILDGAFYSFTAGAAGVAGTNLSIRSGSHDWTLDNMEIRGQPGNGLLLEDGAFNINVRNSRIHDACGLACYGDVVGHRWYGFYIHDAHDVIFEDNDIYNNPGGGGQIYDSGGGSTDALYNITIRRNKVHGNGSFNTSNIGGLIVGKGNALTFTNVRLYDNLVYHNGGLNGTTPTFAPCLYIFGATTAGLFFQNNTFYDCYVYGIFIESGSATGNVLQNNISYGTRNPAFGNIVNNGSGNTLDHNLTTDPLFVNPATFDLHLQAGSAAIDTGTSLSSSFTTDFSGVTRPQGAAWDIGAYEFLSDVTPPSTPTLTATATSSAQINVGWTTATDNVGVTAYLLERCTGAACGTFVQITSTSLTSLLDTGLSAGTTYRYRVRATDAAGNLGAYSAIVSATTVAADVTPPSAPTNLHQVSVTQTTADLAWTASTDNIAVAGYQMSRCQGASCTPNTLVTVGTPSATTFSDSGLLCGTPYRYSVQAVDTSANVGAASGILSVTTLGCVLPPVAPSGVTLAATSDFARHTISWTWSQGAGTAADGFHVQCGKTTLARTTSTTVAVGAPMQLFMKDFLPGQGSWFCTVTAYNAGGDSAEATEASTVVLGPGFGAWGFAF